MDLRHRKGQAFLALVFFIGSIVAIVGILIAFLASSFVDTGYGVSSSALAEAAATSGAQDAMLQLNRNNNASSSYSLPVGSTTVTIAISQNSPSAGYVTILSTASVSNHVRKVQVVLFVNTSTTQTNVISWQDVQ